MKATLKQISRLQYDCAREWEGRFPPEQDWLKPEVLGNFNTVEISEVIDLIATNNKYSYERAYIYLANNHADYESKQQYDPRIEADVDMVNEAERQEEAEQLQSWNDLAEERMYI